MKIPRGGPTAIGGILLLTAGFAGAYIGVIESSQELILQVINLSVPISPGAFSVLFLVAVLSPAAAGIGTMMIGIARVERNREEETLLDPLRYAPVRNHWPRTLVISGVVVMAMIIPSLLFFPIPHAFALIVPVGTCPIARQNGTPLEVPQYAEATYSWVSSDHRPVHLIEVPLGENGSFGNGDPWSRNDSSAGWGTFESNGSVVEFYACDLAPSSGAPAPTSLEVSGTYYSRVL